MNDKTTARHWALDDGTAADWDDELTIADAPLFLSALDEEFDAYDAHTIVRDVPRIRS